MTTTIRAALRRPRLRSPAPRRLGGTRRRVPIRHVGETRRPPYRIASDSIAHTEGAPDLAHRHEAAGYDFRADRTAEKASNCSVGKESLGVGPVLFCPGVELQPLGDQFVIRPWHQGGTVFPALVVVRALPERGKQARLGLLASFRVGPQGQMSVRGGPRSTWPSGLVMARCWPGSIFTVQPTLWTVL